MAGAMHAAAINRTRPYFMSIGAVTDDPSSPFFATWLTASVALEAIELEAEPPAQRVLVVAREGGCEGRFRLLSGAIPSL